MRGVKEKETNSVPKMVRVFGPEKTEPNLLEHLTLFDHGSLQSLRIVLHALGNKKKKSSRMERPPNFHRVLAKNLSISSLLFFF
jgi:hypothetical protein